MKTKAQVADSSRKIEMAKKKSPSAKKSGVRNPPRPNIRLPQRPKTDRPKSPSTRPPARPMTAPPKPSMPRKVK